MVQKLGFADIAQALSKTDEGFQASVPKYWQQGRTCYGGITAGLALTAAERSFDALPPLRSGQVNFIGPVDSAPRFVPKLLRQGKNIISIGVDVICEERLAARVTFIFGASRKSTVNLTPLASAFGEPKTYDRFTPKIAEPFVPKFFLQFETRLVEGNRPLAGAEQGYINAYSRHKDIASRAGLASLVTLADVLPSAALTMTRSVGPMSTVSWMFNMLTDTPVTDDGWWRVDNRIVAAGDGYTSQKMGVWNRAGEQVMDAMQSVAVFV